MNEHRFNQKSLIRLGIAIELLLAAGALSGQQVVLSVGSGSAAPGASVTVPITLTTSGSPQPAGLQWTMAYSSTDISSVTVTAGSSATAASKSVSCFSSSTTTKCVAYGLNTNIMSSGALANATFTIASGTADASTAIQLSGVMATDAMGDLNAISASGTGGSLVIPQPVQPTLTALSCAPATVNASGVSACTVTLSSAALTGGFAVGVSSNNSYLTAPASVTVAAGGTSVGFSATASATVPSAQAAVLTASAAGVSKTFSLNLVAATWTISGSVGTAGSGATIALTGASSASTTANASGNFTFSGLANGSYTITPTLAGHTFSPTSATVTLNNANATAATFTTTGQTWNITGVAGVAGAIVTLTGASTAATTANASGGYTFSGLLNGSYTVTPSLTGYTFSPTSAAVTVNNANATVPNFTATQQTWTITGSVGTAGSGATIALTGTSTASTTANASGSFTFSGLLNGSYTVTPTLAGHTFSPTSASVTVNNANATVPTFTAATAPIWNITGAAGVGGATVTLTGASTATTTANTSGAYTFSGVANGSYTVTPTLAGYTFSPTSAAVTVNGANATVPNFTATQQTWTITGSVGTAGSGATIALSGASTATTTANASGSFTFSGLLNGSYSITPTLAGHTFSPTSASVTVNNANATVITFQVSTAGSGTPFITGFGGSDVRNNYSGWVGTQLTIGSNSLSVTSVGRLCLAGNSGSHTVKFTNANTGQDVAGGSAAVNMAGCQTGQFVYGPLVSPISLQSGVSYYLTSLESAGGDTWYDYGIVTTTSSAAVTNAAYYSGVWASESSKNASYGPPNFEYSVSSGTSFVTGYTVTGRQVRNNFSGWAGTQLTVGSSSLIVTSVGRVCLLGNSGTHQVKFTNVSTGQDVPGASALVSMVGCVAGQFAYSVLPESITLQAGASYYIASQEISGGDTWYDLGAVSTTSAASTTNSVYNAGSWIQTGGANTSYVPPNFEYSAVPETVFITAYSGSDVRNNYSGWVGTQLTVGSSALTVTAVGRLCLAGNLGTHTVEFVNASTGTAVSGGSALVNMAGCSAGQFVYAALATPITLLAGVNYDLATLETAGGDTWYDSGPVITTSAAHVTNSIYFNGNWIGMNTANTAYAPPNFQYHF